MQRKQPTFNFISKKDASVKIDLPIQIEKFLHAKKLEKRSSKTIHTYRQSLNQFSKWYINKQFLEINTEVIREFIQHISYEKVKWDDHPTNQSDEVGLSPRSVNNLIRILKVFFNYLVKERVISSSPLDVIHYQKEEKNTFQVFKDEDVVSLLSAPNRRVYTGLRDYCMMLVLCDTGLRLGEMTSLKVSDVNFHLRQIVVQAEHAKTRTTRVVPISQKTAKELEKLISYMNIDENDFLWLTQFGERYFGDSFGKMLKLYAKRVGVTGARVSAHTFRHYFAVKFLRGGGDPIALARILGHSSLDMTQVYVRFTGSDLSEQHDIASPVTNLIDNGNEKKRGKVLFN